MKTIIAAIDFSDVTDAVIAIAAKIAEPFDAELVIFHSDPLDPTTSVGMYTQNLANDIPLDLEPTIPTVAKVSQSSANVYEEEEEEILNASQRKLNQIIDSLKKDSVKAEFRLFRGEPEEEILALATSVKADIIVVGTHKHSVLHHMLFGELSTNFASKSPCPVLMVPKKSD